MAEQLQGRRIIVTGAASGIGAAAVQVFAAEGATLGAVYNRTAPPKPVEECAHFWLQCDLRNQDAVNATIGGLTAQLGGLDVLVHAAGLWEPSEPGTISEQHLDFMLATNLKSTIWTNQAAWELMHTQQGGHIINIGSSEGVMGTTKATAYGCAKAAVHAWTRSAAKQWGRHNITVNAIAPAMATRGFDRLLNHLGEQADVFEEQLRRIMPLKGMPGDPLRDLGPLLVFLAGNGSDFITGQLLAVDGGLMMLGA